MRAKTYTKEQKKYEEKDKEIDRLNKKERRKEWERPIK